MEIANLLYEHFNSINYENGNNLSILFNEHLDDTLLNRLAFAIICPSQNHPTHQLFMNEFLNHLQKLVANNHQEHQEDEEENQDKNIEFDKKSQSNNGDKLDDKSPKIINLWLKNLSQNLNKWTICHEHHLSLLRVLLAFVSIHCLPQCHCHLIQLLHQAFNYNQRDLFATFVDILPWLVNNSNFTSNLQTNPNELDEIVCYLLEYSSNFCPSLRPLEYAAKLLSHLPIQSIIKTKSLLLNYLTNNNSQQEEENLACHFIIFYTIITNYQHCLVNMEDSSLIKWFQSTTTTTRTKINQISLLFHFSFISSNNSPFPCNHNNLLDFPSLLENNGEILSTFVYQLGQMKKFSKNSKYFFDEDEDNHLHQQQQQSSSSSSFSWKNFLSQLQSATFALISQLYHSNQLVKLGQLLNNICQSSSSNQKVITGKFANRIIKETLRSYNGIETWNDIFYLIQYLSIPNEANQSVAMCLNKLILQQINNNNSQNDCQPNCDHEIDQINDVLIDLFKQNLFLLKNVENHNFILLENLVILLKKSSNLDGYYRFFQEIHCHFSGFSLSIDLSFLLEKQLEILQKFVACQENEEEKEIIFLPLFIEKSMLFLLQQQQQQNKMEIKNRQVFGCLCEFVVDKVNYLTNDFISCFIAYLLSWQWKFYVKKIKFNVVAAVDDDDDDNDGGDVEEFEKLLNNCLAFIPMLLTNVCEIYSLPWNILWTILNVDDVDENFCSEEFKQVFVHLHALDESFLSDLLINDKDKRINLLKNIFGNEFEWNNQQIGEKEKMKCENCHENVGQLVEDILVARENLSMLDCVGD